MISDLLKSLYEFYFILYIFNLNYSFDQKLNNFRFEDFGNSLKNHCNKVNIILKNALIHHQNEFNIFIY